MGDRSFKRAFVIAVGWSPVTGAPGLAAGSSAAPRSTTETRLTEDAVLWVVLGLSEAFCGVTVTFLPSGICADLLSLESSLTSSAVRSFPLCSQEDPWPQRGTTPVSSNGFTSRLGFCGCPEATDVAGAPALSVGVLTT